MADFDKIKRNVAKMVSMNAPEADIDSYISSEGVTVEQVRDYKPVIQDNQHQNSSIVSQVGDVGKAAIGELTAAQKLAAMVANPVKTGADIGRGAAQIYDENRSFMQPGRGVKEVVRQGVVEPAKEMVKGAVNTVIHPVESFKKAPISTVASVLPLGKAVGSAVGKAANSVASRATSVTLGPSTEAISARMANPAAIKSAKTFSEIADRVPETLNSLQKNISKADTEAWKTLSRSNAVAEGAIPKEDILKIVANGKKAIGEAVGKSDKVALKTLADIEADISGLQGQAISESRVKRIIQKLDDNVDWTNTTATQMNKSLQSSRTALDTMLKARNQAYSEAMKPVDEMMNLLVDSEKLFVPKKSPGKGYSITDTTVSKLQNIHKGSPKDASKVVLEKLKQVTGDDYLTETQNAAYKKQFEQPTTHGSRRTVLGSVIGGGVGKLTGSPATGALAGGLAGYVADVEGGRLAGTLVDALSPVKKAVSPALSKAGKSVVFNPRNMLLGQIIQTERGKLRVTGFDKNGNIIGDPINE